MYPSVWIYLTLAYILTICKTITKNKVFFLFKGSILTTQFFFRELFIYTPSEWDRMLTLFPAPNTISFNIIYKDCNTC